MPTAAPSPLTSDDVKRIAHLSRLQLTAAEVERATEQLRGVLEHFAAIQNIDTTAVPPADAVSGRVNSVRMDTAVPESLCPTDALLAAAPAVQHRYLQVPAVFE